eukprot:1173297-Amphidinium_carterae.2
MSKADMSWLVVMTQYLRKLLGQVPALAGSSLTVARVRHSQCHSACSMPPTSLHSGQVCSLAALCAFACKVSKKLRCVRVKVDKCLHASATKTSPALVCNSACVQTSISCRNVTLMSCRNS